MKRFTTVRNRHDGTRRTVCVGRDGGIASAPDASARGSGHALRLALTRIGTDATQGNDGLTLIGVFKLADGGSFAGLDPRARGARLVLQSGAGATRLDVTLPPGAYAGRGTRGWTPNRPRTTWTFKDATGSPTSGITFVRIRNRDQQATREVRVRISGRRGTYPVVAGDEPIRAAVVLGDQGDAAAGSCGESAFTAADCSFNQGGTILSCGR